MKQQEITRRNFMGKAAGAAAITALGGPALFGAPGLIRSYNRPYSKINGVQVGVITYSYRSMADQSAEAVLKYVLDSGINAIELMGDPAEHFAGKPESSIDRRAFYGLMRKRRDGETLTAGEEEELKALEEESKAYNEQVAQWRNKVDMGKFDAFRKMYNDAGVSIYAFKPRAFGSDNSDAEIDYGMRAAKALGASHVTLEHPSDDAQTQRLGRLAKKHGIYVAYHGHEQQTPTFWDTALGQSKFNALNLDLGHYVAAGNAEPLAIVKGKHDRIMSMHTKDRRTPENGKDNVVWGTGDTPIKEALQLIRDQGYDFPATIELEYDIPDGSDAVKEVQKCLEFCRTALT